MKTIRKTIMSLMALTLLCLAASSANAQVSNVKSMPADVAGKISAPSGQLAFIRDGNVYVMNLDGTNEVLACNSTNAFGRLSWAPDNKQIAFTRRGQVDFQGPNLLGGKHRVYDIFKVIVDSIPVNVDWWERVTTSLGGRYPEWSTDGESILYTNDYNANFVDATFPNYQMSQVHPSGADAHPIRKDYQQTDYFSINPTAGPDGRFAFIALFEQKPQGLIVTKVGDPMPSYENVRKQANLLVQAIAPSWSPDGKWIAYVYNDINKPAIYVVSPDLIQKYVIYTPKGGPTPSTNSPSWSPDSKWLTFATGEGSIWICDITGAQLKKVTPSSGNLAPAWSK